MPHGPARSGCGDEVSGCRVVVETEELVELRGADPCPFRQRWDIARDRRVLPESGGDLLETVPIGVFVPVELHRATAFAGAQAGCLCGRRIGKELDVLRSGLPRPTRGEAVDPVLRTPVIKRPSYAASARQHPGHHRVAIHRRHYRLRCRLVLPDSSAGIRRGGSSRLALEGELKAGRPGSRNPSGTP